jgi:hypothetical protein
VEHMRIEDCVPLGIAEDTIQLRQGGVSPLVAPSDFPVL